MSERDVAKDASAPDFRTLFQTAPGLHLALTPDLRIVAASELLAHADEVMGSSQ
jgi:hypothetical protein